MTNEDLARKITAEVAAEARPVLTPQADGSFALTVDRERIEAVVLRNLDRLRDQVG
jgi:hypothetical protein